MSIPQTLTAGDLWTWTDSLSSYPAPTWVLSYHFAGQENFTIDGTASGTDHAFSYAAASSKDYLRGSYDWQSRAVSGLTEVTIARGRLTIKPNLANLAGDGRSFWQKVLDQLQPVILNRASTDQLSMSIAGRSLSRMSWDELLAVYGQAQRAVAAELGEDPSRIFVRFSR